MEGCYFFTSEKLCQKSSPWSNYLNQSIFPLRFFLYPGDYYSFYRNIPSRVPNSNPCDFLLKTSSSLEMNKSQVLKIDAVSLNYQQNRNASILTTKFSLFYLPTTWSKGSYLFCLVYIEFFETWQIFRIVFFLIQINFISWWIVATWFRTRAHTSSFKLINGFWI